MEWLDIITVGCDVIQTLAAAAVAVVTVLHYTQR